MSLDNGFKEKLEAVWGDPKRVARIGLNECFQHDELALDYDDQVNLAIEIGVIAGETREQTVEVFIQRFEEEIFEDELENDSE